MMKYKHIPLCLLLCGVIIVNYYAALTYPPYFDTMDLFNALETGYDFPAFSLKRLMNSPRYIVMYLFGMNHYFAGLDVFWFRLTNVMIHMANTLLVYAFLQALFRAVLTDRIQEPWKVFSTRFGINFCMVSARAVFSALCGLSRGHLFAQAWLGAFLFGLNPVALYAVSYI
ncbi:MAG: hypothetical protein HQM16_03235, partial [Deltaproteobacteria bacterium]|nr:hypothetical protein [Deltaproteobacteria bacterium]